MFIMLQGLGFLSLRTLNLKIVNSTILNNRFRSKYSSSLCLYPKTILESIVIGLLIYLESLCLMSFQRWSKLLTFHEKVI